MLAVKEILKWAYLVSKDAWLLEEWGLSKDGWLLEKLGLSKDVWLKNNL